MTTRPAPLTAARQPTKSGPSPILVVLVLIVAGLGYVGYTRWSAARAARLAAEAAHAQAVAGRAAIDAASREWEDAFHIATLAPRVALTAPLARLLADQRSIEALKVPECLAATRAALLLAANYGRNTMEAFAEKADVSEMMVTYGERVDAFIKARDGATCP